MNSLELLSVTILRPLGAKNESHSTVENTHHCSGKQSWMTIISLHSGHNVLAIFKMDEKPNMMS